MNALPTVEPTGRGPRAVVLAAVVMIGVGVAIDFAVDHGDSPPWTVSVLQSLLFSARKLLGQDAPARGPEAWATPSYEEFNGFLSSMAAEPAAAEFKEAFASDAFLRERWSEFQRDRNTAKFINGLENHPPFRERVAKLAAEPGFADLQKRVSAQPVGQALSRRFASLTSGRAAASAAAGNLAPAGGRSGKAAGMRGTYVTGASDGSEGNATVASAADASSGAAGPSGSVGHDEYRGPPSISREIKIPDPGAGLPVDQTSICGAIDIHCSEGTTIVCGSARRWTCVPLPCGAVNVLCTQGTRAVCGTDGHWTCAASDACKPNGPAPSCAYPTSPSWDAVACQYICAQTSEGH